MSALTVVPVALCLVILAMGIGGVEFPVASAELGAITRWMQIVSLGLVALL